MTTLLEVQGVVHAFGGVRAVDGATLDVEEASITGLIGPNGAGKSTLFNCVSGFLRPQSGRILLGGRRIDRSKPHTIAGAGLVRTFQTPRALTRMTVLENILVAAPRNPGEHLGRMLVPKARRREREARALVSGPPRAVICRSNSSRSRGARERRSSPRRCAASSRW